jgi:hypothetical protein
MYSPYEEEYLQDLWGGGVPWIPPTEPDPPPQSQPPPGDIPWGQMNPPQNVDGGWQDDHTGGFVPGSSQNPAGYQDISYWASRGVPPDEIFDFETGQPRPGWARTDRGYQRTGNSGPAPDPYGGGEYYGGGGGGNYGMLPPRSPFTGQLNYPQFNAPQFNAPAPFSYDPFSYESFSAPTIEQAQKEPGFEYAMQQGLKALENSRAYQGTYRSGATIKGLNDYARNMANQNYDRVYERSADMYDRNRANAFGTYSTNRNNAAEDYSRNYGISRDVFDRNYQGAKDTYSGQAREAELNFGNQWDQYVYENDDAFRRWQAMLNANSF